MLKYIFFFFSKDNWWSQVCPKYFTKLVNLYKGAVVYLLRGRKTFLIPVLFNNYITAALKLLEKLYKVSIEKTQRGEGWRESRMKWSTCMFSGKLFSRHLGLNCPCFVLHQVNLKVTQNPMSLTLKMSKWSHCPKHVSNSASRSGVHKDLVGSLHMVFCGKDCRHYGREPQ